MKISAEIVGATAGPLVHEVDARWLMAYAAGLGETAPEYLDTTRPAGVVAHPLFAVSYEWPVACALRGTSLPGEVLVRGVHATHDLRLHRRARAGDRLSTTAAIICAEPQRSGTYVLTRLETVDADGRPVTTTDYGSVYRGVDLDGDTVRAARASEPPRGGDAARAPDWSESVAIPATLAHVYTECARIWNPIHTDRAVARAAGLPDIILHGTATLALAVSRVLRREPAGAATPVTRIACRFGAMVPLPSTVEVAGWRIGPSLDGADDVAPGSHRVGFVARDQEGRAVLKDGHIMMTTAPDPEESSR